MNTHIDCTVCGKQVTARNHRYARHTHRVNEFCPMSDLPLPASGDSPEAYLHRATIVARLAGLLRDEDPRTVHTYLTTLDRGEIISLAMIAVAGIPHQQRVTEIWSWVCDLPQATVIA